MDTIGTSITERGDKPYYIELTIIHPDGHESWYAVLTEAPRMRDAESEAFAMARKAHPDAEKIEHFMSRTGKSNMGPRRIEQIRAAMLNGTWEGWEFG
jgi:hypothetical protein